MHLSVDTTCSAVGRLLPARTLQMFPGQSLFWTDDSRTSYTQQQQQPFNGPLSGTTRVSRYQKKHSPIHQPDHHPIFITFFHLPRSIASSLFKLRACQSFCTTSFHVFFGLPLSLEPSTSYSIHFFTQSLSSFRNICPYHRNMFCCSIRPRAGSGAVSK